MRTLPLGVARGISDALRGRLSGLARAGMIIVGLSTTVAGFAYGRLRRSAPVVAGTAIQNSKFNIQN